MKIGQVANEAGVPASAIRFYEAIGALPRPTRRNGIREYDSGAVEQLRVLRFFRSVGISTEAIAAMFAENSAQAKAQNRHAVVLDRLAELDGVIAQAHQMKRRLRKLLACECQGDVKRCVIFRSPAKPLRRRDEAPTRVRSKHRRTTSEFAP